MENVHIQFELNERYRYIGKTFKTIQVCLKTLEGSKKEVFDL